MAGPVGDRAVTTPPRRTDAQRKRFLDASVVPVERALLARAEALSEGIEQVPGRPLPPAVETTLWLAAEFRALADELHYW